MADQRVLIEGMWPEGTALPVTGSLSPSGTQNVAITGQPISVMTTIDPGITGVYTFNAAAVTGVAASNNYISLFNPIGSGKTMYLNGAFISSAVTGGTTAVQPMRGLRVTTATGGVLQATSAICKFQTSAPNPVMEVRTGNPTVTAGAPFFSSPPAISATVGSTVVHAITFTNRFSFVPGEGVVLQCTASDVDLVWNLGLLWSEA